MTKYDGAVVVRRVDGFFVVTRQRQNYGNEHKFAQEPIRVFATAAKLCTWLSRHLEDIALWDANGNLEWENRK